MVDDGSAVDILYLDAYKWMRLAENALTPTTFLLYGFTRDHIIREGTNKIAVTVGEHPQTSTVIDDFLVVNCPSTINGIIGRLLLTALKAITSIYHLTMKFSTLKDKWGARLSVWLEGML